MTTPVRGPGRDLDALLAQLPRALPPERDLWPGIEAAIRPAARRSLRRTWPYALAAGLAVVVVAVLLGGRASPPPVEVARVAPAVGRPATGDVSREVVARENEYRATRAALQRTYEERLALLSPGTRARIETDLASIRRAQADIRRALAADPGSRVLLRLYDSTTQQEFDLYSIVGRNTEPVATRTRT